MVDFERTISTKPVWTQGKLDLIGVDGKKQDENRR